MKVLIVDDHTLFREGLEVLLERMGQAIATVSASSCEEAFRLLETHSNVDLVLMDLGLPNISGVEGIVILREKYPDIPIVALSGSENRETVRQAIKSGAMGFIPKTHSSSLLIGALQFILVHKGIYLPPDLIFDTTETRATPAPSSEARVTTTKDLKLTARQGEVLYQILQGKSNKAIARVLNIEESTVKGHVNACLSALNVTTRTEAVIAAHKMKLVFSDQATVK